MTKVRSLPECWGHRGASARFPENTLASFDAAVRDGAEGIETDIHISKDGVLLMFHDPELSRTTDSTGLISERNWYGEDGMEHIRTTAEPRQRIPIFTDLLTFMMLPENQHVKVNLDLKPFSDPIRLFKLMAELINVYPNYETALAPRLLLGLWHPRFVKIAMEELPSCSRCYIGNDPSIAKQYFWNNVEAFSMLYPSLETSDGQRFIQECKSAGKKLMVWTVNEPVQMLEAMRWGVDGILTDKTNLWIDLRAEVRTDYNAVDAKYPRKLLETTPYICHAILTAPGELRNRIEGIAGPFDFETAVPVVAQA